MFWLFAALGPAFSGEPAKMLGTTARANWPGPSVSIGLVTLPEGVDPRPLVKVLDERQPRVEACLTAREPRAPRVQGELHLRSTSGAAEVTEDLIREPPLATCVAAAFAGLPADWPAAAAFRVRFELDLSAVSPALHIAVPTEGQGDLDPATLYYGLARSYGSLRHCFWVSDEVPGDLHLRLAAHPDGRVRTAEIAGGSLTDEKLRACVLRQVERIPFYPKDGRGSAPSTAVLTYELPPP